MTHMPPQITQKEQVVFRLSLTRNQQEWDAICDELKRAGGYPTWWFSEVIMSGFAAGVQHNWAVYAATKTAEDKPSE